VGGNVGRASTLITPVKGQSIFLQQTYIKKNGRMVGGHTHKMQGKGGWRQDQLEKLLALFRVEQ